MQISAIEATIDGQEIKVLKSFADRQAEIDAAMAKIEHDVYAYKLAIKEKMSEKKALQKLQDDLWAEEYGPQMTIWDILDRPESEEK